ncbi:T9SS type A sorting domain-containing protein [Marinilabilia salmonicolor]|uniref:T9SS type A sorting domain-containing protein n=1 Tax=Marinilabilia salmonicolor TaxID=989 RepID=UPI0011E0153D|nr:T9SS type A sorting domain-containing protein [Marinilabilia salmonicolor]
MQQRSAEKITVFPNPVKSKATIQHLPNTVFNVALFDLTGKQVDQKQIRGGEPAEWDFSTYKSGIYMMILRSETGNVQRLKIIKQRE